MCVIPLMWFDVCCTTDVVWCVVPLMWFDVCCTTDVVWCMLYHWCGLMCVIPWMWFDVCRTTDVVWCVSYHWCGLMSSVSQKGPILWSLLSDFNQQHNVLYLVHVFMLLKWNVENRFLLSFPLNYCCMLWLTCGAGEWCMHRKTACDKGRMSGGGGFQQTVLHVTLIISYTHVFMYIQRNSCTHKVSPGSGWSFLY